MIVLNGLLSDCIIVNGFSLISRLNVTKAPFALSASRRRLGQRLVTTTSGNYVRKRSQILIYSLGEEGASDHRVYWNL